MLYVDEEETVGAAQEFADRYSLTGPFLMDQTGEIGRRYQLLGTPTTYFIDANGVVQALQPGIVTLSWIEDNLGRSS
jgi:peroxiredoxin